MLYLLVKADYNDGDYVTAFNPITLEELETIKPLIQAIKARGPWDNYQTGEYADEKDLAHNVYALFGDAFGLFDECFAPHHEHGIHTLKSIKLLNIESIEDLI